MNAEELARRIDHEAWIAVCHSEDAKGYTAVLPYAQLLLDLREGLRVYHVPSKRNDCKSCEVLARADEILKEADRG